MPNAQLSDAPESDLIGEYRDYVYGVSHDVGAPVRAMVEFSRLLSGDYGQKLDDEGKLYLSLIVENGKKLQDMMAGLLSYSRLNTEAQPFAPVDCGEALKSAIEALEDVIRATGAQIDDTPLPEIEGDAVQITHLFSALLSNALKFQPELNRPVVRIVAQPRDGFWLFSVADNGIGIEESFHKKIFKVFQRLHPHDEYPGIGMGLTIAQKIVRRHGGEIWVSSSLGTGAAFFFTIPMRADAHVHNA